MADHERTGFRGQTVVVVGGGAGLGRQYSLDLGDQGANVLIVGRGANAATVADEIVSRGGRAVACVADAREGEAIAAAAIAAFGGIDGLLVNAGIVRDRTFQRMSQNEWDEVLSVHVGGTHACVRAIWPHMIAKGYGRIVLTVSGAGLHGNFGQANYAAAKGAIYSLMRTLAIEGKSKGILTNAIAPMAATGMTEGVFTEEVSKALPASSVSPFVLALLHPHSTENGAVIEAGGGWGGKMRWERSAGVRFTTSEISVDTVLDRWAEIVDFKRGSDHPASTADSMRAGLGDAAHLLGPPR